MAWRIEFSNPAHKQFKKLDRVMAIAILNALHRLLDELNDPTLPAHSDLKKMKGEESAWRLRVRDYRVIFEQHGDRLVITVLKVGHRREIYRD